MADQWYYSGNGQRRGPVSEEELKQLAASGQLKPTDKVWRKGMASWATASTIEGLIPEQNEPPPLEPDLSQPPPLEGTNDALSFLNAQSPSSRRANRRRFHRYFPNRDLSKRSTRQNSPSRWSVTFCALSLPPACRSAFFCSGCRTYYKAMCPTTRLSPLDLALSKTARSCFLASWPFARATIRPPK